MKLSWPQKLSSFFLIMNSLGKILFLDDDNTYLFPQASHSETSCVLLKEDRYSLR